MWFITKKDLKQRHSRQVQNSQRNCDLKYRILVPSILFFFLLFPFFSFSKCIDGDCQNGQGTFIYPDGKRYVGEWKDGKRHGQGVSTHPDGWKYVGEFKDGVLSGHGTYTYPDGRKYVGEINYIICKNMGSEWRLFRAVKLRQDIGCMISI